MEDTLAHRYEAWLEALAGTIHLHAPDGRRIDAHTHLGIDAGSGLEMTRPALDRQLDLAAVDHAVVIPLHASDGYHRTSMQLIEHAERSGGRFSPLYRVDPDHPGPEDGAQAAFAAGAAGLKLHPESDAFSLLDPRLAGPLEVAAAQRAIVLVHTGVDVEDAAPDTIELARRYPEARFVLGHVPAEALHGVLTAASTLPNVWTCLSWWGPMDVAIAMQWAAPDRILHGSDPPYGNAVTGMAQTVLVGRALGFDDDQLGAVLAGNADRLLDRTVEPGRSHWRVPEAANTRDLLAETPLAFRRCYSALIAANAASWQGGDPASYLRFAGQSLEPVLVEPALASAADRLREAVGLMGDLHVAGRREQAYAVGVASLTQALTVETSAR